MPEQPREPEFLPDWYAGRLTRARRRRPLVRTAVSLLLVVAAGAALWPRHTLPAHAGIAAPAPAEDGKPEAGMVATEGPATTKVPPGARRALQALHDVLPPSVAIEHLAFHCDRGVTTLSLSCTAGETDAAAELVEALRALPLFLDVRLETSSDVAGGADPSRPHPNPPVEFDVRAIVTVPGAQ